MQKISNYQSFFFSLLAGIFSLLTVTVLAQQEGDGVSIEHEFSNISRAYYDYVFEDIDDSTYFFMKGEGKKTQIIILDHNLDTLFIETYDVRYNPSKLVRLLPFDENSFGVYFYERKNWGLFQLRSKLHEFTFDFERHHPEMVTYNMLGHISSLRVERFNGKTVVAGNTQTNLGFGINALRIGVPLIYDLLTLSNYKTEDRGYDFVQSPGSTIGLYLLNIVIPFYRYRKDRNFLVELKKGMAVQKSEGRFQTKEIKEASVEDMLVKGDTVLYVAYTNSSKKKPSIVIDAFSPVFRKMYSGTTRGDKKNRVLNVDLIPSEEDTLRFNSMFVSRKGFNKGTNLMEIVFPRTFIHKKASRIDATLGDEEFEPIKTEEEIKLEQKKNSKNQSILSKNAKTVKGIFFIDSVIAAKKEIKTKIKTRRSGGRDVLPIGENFRSRTMYSNERILYYDTDTGKLKFTLRQLFYVKPHGGDKQVILPSSSSPTIGGPANSAIGEVAPVSVSPTLATQKVGYDIVTKNLSIRIENMRTGDFSQFIVDKEYFFHEMDASTNQIEKMQAVLNVIEGKAFVSLVDKNNNLKTYRYTMEGGDLIYINRLAEATEISPRKKFWSKIFFFAKGSQPYGYFDMDLNMGDRTSFILTTYVKMPFSEDGEVLKGIRKYQFLIQKYQIHPDSRPIGMPEFHKTAPGQPKVTHKSRR